MSAKHTPGPWQIWPGPAYCGGGEDLCIGAGDKWLANMDHRNCKSREAHFAVLVDHDKAGLETDTAICSFSDEITEEQRANARLIAAAPDLLDTLQRIYKLLYRVPMCDNVSTALGIAERAIAKAEGRS